MKVPNTAFTLAALLVLNLQCATQRVSFGGQGQAPTVTEVRGRLGVAAMPEPFVRADQGRGAKVITSGFEVRLLEDAAAGELLFAGKDYDRTYGDNIYAVSLDGRFKSRRATGVEWERARRVAGGGEQISAVGDDPERPNSSVISKSPVVTYRGRSLARTGASWTSRAALASPDGKWIAVFSHTTEQEARHGALPGSGVAGRGEGEMFVDVYDSSTGEKVMSGRAPHAGGQHPAHDFERAVWLGNKYLIVPLSYYAHGERYFLGILPVE